MTIHKGVRDCPRCAPCVAPENDCGLDPSMEARDCAFWRDEPRREPEHTVYLNRPAESAVASPLPPEARLDMLHQAIEASSVPGVWPEARKDDGGKLPYHLIAPEFLEGLATILEFGAVKYSPRNWEKGMDWARPFSALMRHMWAWWRGENVDAETGRSHLWHAACCLMFLVAYEARGAGKDDRPNSTR